MQASLSKHPAPASLHVPAPSSPTRPPTHPVVLQKRFRLRHLVEAAFDPDEALAEHEREEAQLAQQQAQQLASPAPRVHQG